MPELLTLPEPPGLTLVVDLFSLQMVLSLSPERYFGAPRARPTVGEPMGGLRNNQVYLTERPAQLNAM